MAEPPPTNNNHHFLHLRLSPRTLDGRLERTAAGSNVHQARPEIRLRWYGD